ncbi:DUF817 domain-containing protein [Micromonospora sagamiensis]|uniref:Uncharacterized membrane protein YoaT (DUF817 family) n=1 Tax=Micromonospora sagamiensis TaxID=47875 RepID=A0A562WER1_9ACTN|nr:DUF817 domain-containing protein [Micromonospora sagamiensis]TWJ28773.1 uncharacterized membrane protein YoaT (DUF817 family) [Micromonospora sagamiensis]BCL12321.1 membrane protein [Micromonospora sagamiensis]
MRTPGEPATRTTTERSIDARVHAILARLPQRGPASWLTEFVVFGLKQAWACVFGGAMLVVIFAAHLWYPEDATLARNDFLTIAAVAIQIVMVAARLETLRELRVVILFHLVGTAMELFKTHVGSWSYLPDGVLRIGAVPLFSGFMYAAVGSYMVRVNRLFDLRFARYPKRWATAVLATAIYANFFTNHYVLDIRWLLIAVVVLVFGRCVMQFRVFRFRWRMPLLLAFLLVAFFIWLAENIATWSNAWLYPSQLGGWQPVSPAKLASWFLLMIISVVLVTWISPPQPPDDPPPAPPVGTDTAACGPDGLPSSSEPS